MSCANLTEVVLSSGQLYLFFANQVRGKPLSKQRLSHWIVEAISIAYKSEVLALPARGMMTSWALFRGVSVEDICVAASWVSLHTFVQFY